MAKIWSIQKNTTEEYIFSDEELEIIAQTKKEARIVDKKDDLKNYKKENLDAFQQLKSDVILGIEPELTSDEITWYRHTKNLEIGNDPLEVPQRVLEYKN